VVVGLGNPGPTYENTRHNAGMWCIEELARRAHAGLERTDRRARTARVKIEGQNAVLVAPRTYVNDSGVAVRWALEKLKSGPDRLIVVLDEVNLAPGDVRIRRRGSPGGHNGMKSIVAAIGTEEFVRVRIGVGRPGSPGKRIDHVLGEFSREDRALVDDAVRRAADGVAAIIRDGIESAMNTFN
jgi:PTH1 family peptidyl-tRNA hydrolase